MSLGLPAIFLFGGLKRNDKPQPLSAAAWRYRGLGRPGAAGFHGVAPLADGEHAVMGRQRINLTFRKAISPLTHIGATRAGSIRARDRFN